MAKNEFVTYPLPDSAHKFSLRARLRSLLGGNRRGTAQEPDPTLNQFGASLRRQLWRVEGVEGVYFTPKPREVIVEFSPEAMKAAGEAVKRILAEYHDDLLREVEIRSGIM